MYTDVLMIFKFKLSKNANLILIAEVKSCVMLV